MYNLFLVAEAYLPQKAINHSIKYELICLLQFFLLSSSDASERLNVQSQWWLTCPVRLSVSQPFIRWFLLATLLLWSIEMFMLRHINTTYMSRSHATHISSVHTSSKQQVTVGWLRWPTDSVTVRLNLRLS